MRSEGHELRRAEVDWVCWMGLGFVFPLAAPSGSGNFGMGGQAGGMVEHQLSDVTQDMMVDFVLPQQQKLKK